MSSEWNLVFDAFGKLISLFVDKFGVTITITSIVVVYLVFVARRIYLDYRKDKDSDRAIRAMETAVQRSAQEAREWRVLFMKEKAGWSLEEAERIVMAAEFENPAEARTALEKGVKNNRSKSKKRKKS